MRTLLIIAIIVLALPTDGHANDPDDIWSQVKGDTQSAADILKTVQGVFGGYTDIFKLIESNNPTAEDQILQVLQGVQSKLDNIDSTLQTVNGQLASLVWEQSRADYLKLQRDVQDKEALARAAYEDFGQWNRAGKTDSLKFNSASENAHLAAGQLSQPANYLRPAAKPGDPDVFEYRATLLPYLYALTVRLGVVAVEQATSGGYSNYAEEFHVHIARLRDIAKQLGGVIVCHQMLHTGVSLGDFVYSVSSTCTDTLSGYTSVVDGNAVPDPGTPTTTGWQKGTQEDADALLQYLSFYDRWNVEEFVGKHAVEAMAAQLEQLFPIGCTLKPAWVCPAVTNIEVSEVGPLAGGQCLSHRYPYSAVMVRCARGSLDQTWSAPKVGFSGVLSDGSGHCWDMWGWKTGRGILVRKKCAPQAAGQRWMMSEADAPGWRNLKWARNQSLCLEYDSLTASFGLSPCASTPKQRWSRTWPLEDPVVPFPKVLH